MTANAPETASPVLISPRRRQELPRLLNVHWK